MASLLFLRWFFFFTRLPLPLYPTVFLYSLLGPPQLSCPVWFLFSNWELALSQTGLELVISGLSLRSQSRYCLSVPVTPAQRFLYVVFRQFGSFPHCPYLTLLYNVRSTHIFGAEALPCLVQSLDEHFLQTAVLQSLLPPEPHPSAPSLPFSSIYCSSPPWSRSSLLQPLPLILLSMAAFVLEISLSSSFGVFWVWFFPPLSIFFSGTLF